MINPLVSINVKSNEASNSELEQQRRNHAEQAIRNIGTNAIPLFLAELRALD